MIEALSVLNTLCNIVKSVLSIAGSIYRYIKQKKNEKSEPSADTEAR